MCLVVEELVYIWVSLVIIINVRKECIELDFGLLDVCYYVCGSEVGFWFIILFVKLWCVMNLIWWDGGDWCGWIIVRKVVG